MIRPDKYINLNTCVLSLSAAILADLRKQLAIPIAELEERVVKKFGEHARRNFLPALSLLFLLGKLRFDLSSDAIFLQRADRELGQ